MIRRIGILLSVLLLGSAVAVEPPPGGVAASGASLLAARVKKDHEAENAVAAMRKKREPKNAEHAGQDRPRDGGPRFGGGYRGWFDGWRPEWRWSWRRVRFLSPDGSDQNNGSRRAPWRTLAAANAALRPGDTLMLLPGEYEGVIAPEVSGYEGEPIRYLAYRTGTVTLTGGAAAKTGGRALIDLRNRDYIQVEGVRLEPPPGGRWIRLDDCEECYFTGIVLAGEKIGATPVECRDVSFFRFDRIRITVWPEAQREGGAAPLWRLRQCRIGALDGIQFPDGGGFALETDRACGDLVLRNMAFLGRGACGICPGTEGDMLLERCVFADGAAPGAALLGWPNLIFRNNLLLNSDRSEDGESGNAAIYSNTVYRAGQLPAGGNNLVAPDSGECFRRMSLRNYQLRNDSAAVDAGDVVSRAVGAGAGRKIAVSRPERFYDGFGVPGEEGDLVWVGQDRLPVRVIYMDRAARTLTLETEVRWEDADAVTFPYHGTAPDLGAYEAGIGATGPALVPTEVGIASSAQVL